MGKKLAPAKQAAPRSLAMLDAASADPAVERALLITNQSNEIIVLRTNTPEEDAVVPLQGQVLLSPTWSRNPPLRRAVLAGRLSCEWVDSNTLAKELPTFSDAPADILPDESYEREFARQISLKPEPEALADIKVNARRPNGEVDVRYMKERFRKVLSLARWLERRTQNRSRMLKALDQRIDEIRAM